jgi:hypothetical protein
MLALDVNHMKMVLAAMIKAIIVVMGEPNVAVRQCPLAMDKWLHLVIVPKHTVLGFIINTNRLTIAKPCQIPPRGSQSTQLYLAPYQRCFKVSEAQKLTGKLARLAKGENWIFYLAFVFVNCICIIQEQATCN